MQQKFPYNPVERLIWSIVIAAGGIFVLFIGLAFHLFTPQENSVGITSALEVLTGSTSQQPTFVTPIGRIAIIIFGIILLYYATRIYLTGSAVVIVDKNSISYKLKDEILKLEWSDVVNVTSSPFCGGISFGAGEVLTLVTSKNTKLSVNSYIKGYENLKQEIYAKTKKQS
jgi:hypothetical protein